MPATIKKKGAAEATQVSIRVSETVLEDAETLIPHLSEKHGKPATRVDVLRAAMIRGLRDLKRDAEREGG